MSQMAVFRNPIVKSSATFDLQAEKANGGIMFSLKKFESALIFLTGKLIFQ